MKFIEIFWDGMDLVALSIIVALPILIWLISSLISVLDKLNRKLQKLFNNTKGDKNEN